MDVPPFDYLKDVLLRVATHPQHLIAQLTPRGFRDGVRRTDTGGLRTRLVRRSGAPYTRRAQSLTFEVVPVVTSAEAAAAVASRL